MQGYDTILVPIDVYSDYELVVENNNFWKF